MNVNYDKIDYATYLLKHEQKQNKGAKSKDSERTKTYQSGVDVSTSDSRRDLC